MKHIQALIYKFLFVTILFMLILGFGYQLSFGSIFLISLLLTGTTYLLGDIYILPRFGNLAATVLDFVLLFFGLWIMGNLFIEIPIRFGMASFLSALFISIFELFFHVYLIRNIIDEKRNKLKSTLQKPNPIYEMEFSDEYFNEWQKYVNEESKRDDQNQIHKQHEIQEPNEEHKYLLEQKEERLQDE